MKHIVLAALLALPLLFSTTASADAPAGAPVVKLVDAGKGAKKQLRFTAKKGLARTMVMTMKMAMGQGGAPMTLPVMKMTMDMKVTDVSAEGDIKYTFVLR